MSQVIDFQRANLRESRLSQALLGDEASVDNAEGSSTIAMEVAIAPKIPALKRGRVGGRRPRSARDSAASLKKLNRYVNKVV